MKLVFVYWGFENAGSMLDLKGYARAAEAAGRSAAEAGRTALALKRRR